MLDEDRDWVSSAQDFIYLFEEGGAGTAEISGLC